MVRVYSAEGRELHHGTLSAPYLSQIGRLIRICADIEIAVTNYIAALSGGTELLTEIMLGKTAITRRLDMARQLADAQGGDAGKRHREIFGAVWVDVNKVRNAVAHGALLGFDDEERPWFLLSEIDGVQGSQVSKTTVGCAIADIKHFVSDARWILREVRKEGVPSTLPKKSAPRSIERHPKGQRKR